MTEAAGTEELDLQEAAELFRLIYPAFAALLDKAEAARGPLKEFHLAMAAEHAKSGVRILGWDSRRAINAIFEQYKEHYLAEGRIAADLWAADQFGCDLEAAIVESEDVRELEERIKAVVMQIRQRESELQRLRRELGQLEELRAELSRPVILHGSVANIAGGNIPGEFTSSEENAEVKNAGDLSTESEASSNERTDRSQNDSVSAMPQV
ncbi:hypothetical protein SAMN05216312_103468 [Cohnella sp. OV330]|uniref:hypothetical protein n=1 Tax=Cohnella sp. OV330 TaxID=1855288 RepID=UPI0008F054C5|nr:hypothetical protein [Cohnella sp. OV330]SFB09436.1 hypothetical protein SAMN05216312_103468 [Cohnella sp. OV330]